jgi:hypothetical protein
MKVHEGVDVHIHVFLTSALAGGEWSAPCSSCFIPGEAAPSIQRIGGWVGPRTGLEDLQSRRNLAPGT